MVSSIFPAESKTTERTEYLTVSPIPKETATIIELNISPITINVLWPFLRGIFLVPIFTRINLLSPPNNKIIEIASNITIILFARRPAGRPNTFSSIS